MQNFNEFEKLQKKHFTKFETLSHDLYNAVNYTIIFVPFAAVTQTISQPYRAYPNSLCIGPAVLTMGDPSTHDKSIKFQQ